MCLELQRGWVTHGKDTTLPAPSKTLPVPVALLHSKDLGSTDHEFSEYPLDAYVYPPGWMWELQPSTCSHLLQASLTPWSSLTMSCVPRSHSGQGPKTNWWQALLMPPLKLPLNVTLVSAGPLVQSLRFPAPFNFTSFTFHYLYI